MISFEKKNLERVSTEQGFIRDNYEKVLRLTEILRFMHNDKILADSLVLKGGTAINLAIFDLPRLSVDIDLDFSLNCGRDDMMRQRKEITDSLVLYLISEGYQMLPRTKNPHSLDSWVFSYQNAAGNKDVIKIEINYSDRCHVLPTEKRNVRIDILGEVVINILNPVEMFASKIKALVSRAAVRDLYDVNGMIKAGLFSSPNERDMLRKIFVFYMSVGSSCKAEEVDIEHIDYRKIEQIGFPQVRAHLLPVLRKNDPFDFEEAKRKVIAFLEEMMVFDEQDMQYINSFRKRLFDPSLLFGKGEIADRLSTHPMGLWKCRTPLA